MLVSIPRNETLICTSPYVIRLPWLVKQRDTEIHGNISANTWNKLIWNSPFLWSEISYVKQYVRTSNEFHYYDGLMKYGCICFFIIYHLELVPADMNTANDIAPGQFHISHWMHDSCISDAWTYRCIDAR